MAAPATHDEGQDISRAVARLTQAGYRVKMMPTVSGAYGYFSGTDDARARDINALFHDDDVKAIVCLNGGYGSARILDKLDYDYMVSRPKWVVGFSDITALQVALWEKSRLVTANGPLMVTLGGSNDYTANQFFNGLKRASWRGALALPVGRTLTTINTGTAKGPIVGGNLTLLASLVGTPYALDGTGCILVLEDTGESSYRIDRMMNQLWQSGLLSRVSAIVYGDFTASSHDDGDFTTDEVLDYYAHLARVPAIKGLPVGHTADKAFIPYGITAYLDATGPEASLSFQE
nr:LD-carboxypeptidase [Megasphaera sp.]